MHLCCMSSKGKLASSAQRQQQADSSMYVGSTAHHSPHSPSKLNAVCYMRLKLMTVKNDQGDDAHDTEIHVYEYAEKEKKKITSEKCRVSLDNMRMPL